MELAQIAHVRFHGVAGMPALLDVGEPAAEQLEHLVHRAVEQHVVIGHVEVAVVVDPGGLDPHHRGDERGKEQWFESGPIEHAGYVREPAATRPLARFSMGASTAPHADQDDFGGVQAVAEVGMRYHMDASSIVRSWDMNDRLGGDARIRTESGL